MRVLPCIILCVLHVSAQEDYHEDDDSYSYQKFRGPVSGQVAEYSVPGYHNEEPSVDYFAQPDYLYTYGVEDPKRGLSQLHREARKEDEVVGEYKVLQPDGFLRIVKYTADGEHGFQASVQYIKV